MPTINAREQAEIRHTGGMTYVWCVMPMSACDPNHGPALVHTRMHPGKQETDCPSQRDAQM